MTPLAVALLCLVAAHAGAVEYVFQNSVTFQRNGSCIVLVNARDKQELILVPENVVAVLPADHNDNNAYTSIILSGDGTVIKLQQRNNPGEEVVATLKAMGLGFVWTTSDRDLREQETYLINVRRVTLIERNRTDSERSDTIVYYIGGTGLTAKFTINQSTEAYRRLRDAVTQAR
jgi:hypothetical protein